MTDDLIADPDDEWRCGFYDGLRRAGTRADEAEAAIERVRAVTADFDANGNGCALGDPTAEIWHKAARLIREALDDIS